MLIKVLFIFVWAQSSFCVLITKREESLQTYPPDFIFGVATAAYQIEGGWNEDGRGRSIWDDCTQNDPSRIVDRSNGDIAADSYHKFDEDLELLKDLGVQSYRFSISWNRIMTNGDRLSYNKKGVDYYNMIIDKLISNNIIPMVTMYHYDLPSHLEEFGGLTNNVIVDYFEDYANILFEKFGDRVKHWITFNEPLEICINGYGDGNQAPNKNLSGFGEYLCAHNLILAHATAYNLYKTKYKEIQNGEIGITLDSRWVIADSEKNINLIDRYMAFNLGWFMDPLFKDPPNYPAIMIDQIGKNSKIEGLKRSRLPVFTQDQRKLLNNSCDFLGLNYYTSRIVSPGREVHINPPSFYRDQNLSFSVLPSWKRAKSKWLYSVPEGIFNLLQWIHIHYNGPKIYVTENGWSDDGQLNDVDRMIYLNDHLINVQHAETTGVNVKGYFHWSLLDNFEWNQGYTEKFGLVYVNFTDPNRSRTQKDSSKMYKNIIKQRGIL